MIWQETIHELHAKRTAKGQEWSPEDSPTLTEKGKRATLLAWRPRPLSKIPNFSTSGCLIGWERQEQTAKAATLLLPVPSSGISWRINI